MTPCEGSGFIIFCLTSPELILERWCTEGKATLFRHAFTSSLTSPAGNVYFNRKLKSL